MPYSNQVSPEEQAAGFELVDVENPTRHLASPSDFLLDRRGAQTVQAAVRQIDAQNRIVKVEKPGPGGRIVYIHESLQGTRWRPTETGEMFSLDQVRKDFLS